MNVTIKQQEQWNYWNRYKICNQKDKHGLTDQINCEYIFCIRRVSVQSLKLLQNGHTEEIIKAIVK